jgi:large subunit ribosomal protein L4
MAKKDVFDMAKKKVGEIDLADEIFAAPIKEHLFWEAVRWQQAGSRSGTASTKGRAEIRGSTRKLFRQKGTGRARRGSMKSPLLRGGGIAFGPKPRDFSYTLPKKVRRKALACALSRRSEENALFVLDSMEMPEIKTRRVQEFMSTFGLTSALIIDQDNRALTLSGRNIKGVTVLPVQGLNVLDVLKHDNLVLTRQAVEAIEGRLK